MSFTHTGHQSLRHTRLIESSSLAMNKASWFTHTVFIVVLQVARSNSLHRKVGISPEIEIRTDRRARTSSQKSWQAASTGSRYLF